MTKITRTKSTGKLVKWKKIGGGDLVLKDGRTVKSGQTFEAEESDIPTAFMDTLIRTEVAPSAVSGDGGDDDETPYTKKEVDGGWDVFDQDGEKLNDDPLTAEDADEFIQSLLAE